MRQQEAGGCESAKKETHWMLRDPRQLQVAGRWFGGKI